MTMYREDELDAILRDSVQVSPVNGLPTRDHEFNHDVISDIIDQAKYANKLERELEDARGACDIAMAAADVAHHERAVAVESESRKGLYVIQLRNDLDRIFRALGVDYDGSESIHDAVSRIKDLLANQRLSPEARAARMPLPPADLIATGQDRVHTEVGRGRPAKTVRNMMTERKNAAAPPARSERDGGDAE